MQGNSVCLIRLKSVPEINQYKAWYITKLLKETLRTLIEYKFYTRKPESRQPIRILVSNEVPTK